MNKIGGQNGIVAAHVAEVDLDPAHTKAYDKRSSTFQELVRGHNETVDVQSRQDGQITQLFERLTALEDRRPASPFPASS